MQEKQKSKPSDFLCHCMKVSKDTISNCIKEGCSSVQEVVECTKAGSCCTACHNKIIKIIQEEKIK